MKLEVESYIIANMKRALVLWNQAQEAIQEEKNAVSGKSVCRGYAVVLPMRQRLNRRHWI